MREGSGHQESSRGVRAPCCAHICTRRSTDGLEMFTTKKSEESQKKRQKLVAQKTKNGRGIFVELVSISTRLAQTPVAPTSHPRSPGLYLPRIGVSRAQQTKLFTRLRQTIVKRHTLSLLYLSSKVERCSREVFLRLSALGCGPRTAERDQRGENPSNAHPSFTSACVRVSFGSTNSVSGGAESPSDRYEPPQLVNCGLASLAPQSANCGFLRRWRRGWKTLSLRRWRHCSWRTVPGGAEQVLVVVVVMVVVHYNSSKLLPRIWGSIYCLSSVKRTKASGVNKTNSTS